MTPSGEVADALLTELPATTQNRFNSDDQHTDVQKVEDGKVLCVQVIPFGEVMAIFELFATAQKRCNSGDQHTDIPPDDVGKVPCVHVMPSGDVAATAEIFATAQNRFNSGDQQTEYQPLDVGRVLDVHSLTYADDLTRASSGFPLYVHPSEVGYTQESLFLADIIYITP